MPARTNKSHTKILLGGGEVFEVAQGFTTVLNRFEDGVVEIGTTADGRRIAVGTGSSPVRAIEELERMTRARANGEGGATTTRTRKTTAASKKRTVARGKKRATAKRKTASTRGRKTQTTATPVAATAPSMQEQLRIMTEGTKKERKALADQLSAAAA